MFSFLRCGSRKVFFLTGARWPIAVFLSRLNRESPVQFVHGRLSLPPQLPLNAFLPTVSTSSSISNSSAAKNMGINVGGTLKLDYLVNC